MPVGELKHLIIDVPYTAIPTDVHRAMKEAGAVAKNFPLSASTLPTLSMQLG